MPNVNWDKVPDSKYPPIPPGEYPVKLTKVFVRESQKHEEYWSLQFQVTGGELVNKYIFDALFFTEGAMSRTKFVCKRLGLATEGECNLQPDDLVGASAQMTVIESTDSKNTKGYDIPWDGYKSIDGDGDEPKSDDDLPF